MNQEIYLGGRRIAADAPVFIVAEMSANHLQDYDRAIEIIHAAKEAGADAIKLQTYTADTMTVDSDADCFINKGGLWDGIKEYDLYKQAYTPWEWHAGLMEEAKKCGLLCFSSPFDATAVDFLETLDAPAYKIASYEINDIPLIRRVAKLHKPVIFATGVAHLEDIERAMNVCREFVKMRFRLPDALRGRQSAHDSDAVSDLWLPDRPLRPHDGRGCRCRRRFPRRADGGKAPDLKTQRRRSGWRIFHGAPGI